VSVTRPTPADRLGNADAVLTRSDLKELGYERRAVDAIFGSLSGDPPSGLLAAARAGCRLPGLPRGVHVERGSGAALVAWRDRAATGGRAAVTRLERIAFDNDLAPWRLRAWLRGEIRRRQELEARRLRAEALVKTERPKEVRR
jgi:hypothetical protein